MLASELVARRVAIARDEARYAAIWSGMMLVLLIAFGWTLLVIPLVLSTVWTVQAAREHRVWTATHRLTLKYEPVFRAIAERMMFGQVLTTDDLLTEMRKVLRA